MTGELNITSYSFKHFVGVSVLLVELSGRDYFEALHDCDRIM